MRRKLVWLLFLCLITGVLQAGEYTFEDALNRVLSIDENVLAAQKEVDKARSEKSAAFGLHLPKIGLKGSYTFINDPIIIDLNPIRDVMSGLHGGITLPDFKTRVQDDRFFKTDIYASLPVFAGGKIIAANKAAQSAVDESLAKLEAVKNNVLVEVSDKYFTALLAREVVKVRKAFLENAQELAGNSEKMFKSGMISKVEHMSANITMFQAQRDYNTSLNDMELAQTVLKNLLYVDEDIELNSKLFILNNNDFDSLNYFRQMAAANNTYLKILEAKLKLTDAAVKSESASFLPTVYLFGTKELYEKDLTLLDPKYAYGIGFEWNLFEGMSTVNKTKAAKRQRESVELAIEKQRRDINSAVDFYHKRIANAIYKYDWVQEEIIYAREVLNTRQLGFKAGTSTSLEVNVARTQLLKSELDSLQASYECVVGLANLLNVSGTVGSFTYYKQKALDTGAQAQ